jgi:hypothetical protein
MRTADKRWSSILGGRLSPIHIESPALYKMMNPGGGGGYRVFENRMMRKIWYLDEEIGSPRGKLNNKKPQHYHSSPVLLQ